MISAMNIISKIMAIAAKASYLTLIMPNFICHANHAMYSKTTPTAMLKRTIPAKFR